MVGTSTVCVIPYFSITSQACSGLNWRIVTVVAPRAKNDQKKPPAIWVSGVAARNRSDSLTSRSWFASAVTIPPQNTQFAQMTPLGVPVVAEVYMIRCAWIGDIFRLGSESWAEPNISFKSVVQLGTLPSPLGIQRNHLHAVTSARSGSSSDASSEVRNTARESECFNSHTNSCGERYTFNGTVTIPAFARPPSHAIQWCEFLWRIPTWSPGWRPSISSALATRLKLLSNSLYVCSDPSAESTSATRSRCSRTVFRISSARIVIFTSPSRYLVEHAPGRAGSRRSASSAMKRAARRAEWFRSHTSS